MSQSGQQSGAGGGTLPVALVTGASRGLGRAIAVALGRAGFAVVVTARTMAQGEGRHDGMSSAAVPGSVAETVAAIEAAGGTALGLRLDLLDRASIDAAIAGTLGRFGRLDVLVANGIYQGPAVQQKLLAIDLDDAERATTGNFVNQFHLARVALKPMLDCKDGRLISMTTMSSTMPTMSTSGLF